VLPLMLTVMTARLVGNIFTEGLYDMHIHSRRLNFLDEDEGVSKLVELHDLSVCEIMTRAPRHMAPVMRVGDLYDLLKLNKHHCYPVGKFFVECLLVSSSDPVVSQSNRTRIVFWSAPSCARSFARSCSTRRLA
jgi:hypothetical protein